LSFQRHQQAAKRRAIVLYAASQRRGLLLGQAGSHQPARKRRRKGVQRRIGLYQRAPGFDFVVRRFNIEVSTRHHRDGRRHCPRGAGDQHGLGARRRGCNSKDQAKNRNRTVFHPEGDSAG
jgi:hypothetical protein